MNVTLHGSDPAVRRGWRVRVVVAGVPAVVIGWFALGPVAVALAAAVIAIVVLAAWAGPRINARLYGQQPSAGGELSVQSAINRLSGTLCAGPNGITWQPWKRYEARARGFCLNSGDIEAVDIYARRGIPASCRIEVRTVNGEVTPITVFTKASAVAAALRGHGTGA